MCHIYEVLEKEMKVINLIFLNKRDKIKIYSNEYTIIIRTLSFAELLNCVFYIYSCCVRLHSIFIGDSNNISLMTLPFYLIVLLIP